MCFTNQTIDNKIIIGENDLQEMQTYVDLYHEVHMDMKGHTGWVITFGMWVLKAKLSRQRTSSIILIELDVIGNSDYLPYKIWYDNFMDTQGYP